MLRAGSSKESIDHVTLDANVQFEMQFCKDIELTGCRINATKNINS
jgi:hypothetical protein